MTFQNWTERCQNALTPGAAQPGGEINDTALTQILFERLTQLRGKVFAQDQQIDFVIQSERAAYQAVIAIRAAGEGLRRSSQPMNR